MTFDKFKDYLEEAGLGIKECSNIILKQEVTKMFRGMPAEYIPFLRNLCLSTADTLFLFDPVH
jgi:maleate cis-trans isomerase